jgi:hypothetical protein
MPDSTFILASLALLFFVWLSIASTIAAIRFAYWPLLIFSIGQLFTGSYFLSWFLTAPWTAVNPIYVLGIAIGGVCDLIFTYACRGWEVLARRGITLRRILLLG